MSFARRSAYAPLPSTNRGQTVHLNGDPKGTNFIYCNGRSVIIRNIEKPEICVEYTQHSAAVTVAKYCPTGYYIASGDVSGNIRIWDTVNKENILKTETRVFAGRINDLDWDHESKRIIAVGDGKDKFGHAFLFDTASSVGEISGHSKVINSVSIRPNRPFRAATCSDDCTVNFYHGVPYKFAKSISDHTRFVQCVRFSPNGDQFVSSGMDGKVFMYDGKTGDRLSEFVGHTGGVFSVSWSPDGKFLETTSADTTVKIFDVATSQAVNTFHLSDPVGRVEDQQVGSLWQGQHILSISLNGDINYFDRNSIKPIRRLGGHQKAITALSISNDRKTIYSGSYDGRICAWQDSQCHSVAGAGHSNQVTCITSNGGDSMFTTGMDDSMRIIDTATQSFSPIILSTTAIPKSVSARNNKVVVTAINNEIITASTKGEKLSSQIIAFTPTCVAIGETEIAVGSETGKVHVFSLDMVPSHILESNRGSITALSYSPNSALLAAADANRAVLVYDTVARNVKLNQWVFHNAKVTCVSWSPDGLHAVSGSLDTNVEVWSIDKPMKHVCIKGAHLEGVNGVCWIDDSTVASAGQDGFVKVWQITHV